LNLTVNGPPHRARVLIVDDQRANRQLLEIMLASENLTLLTAGTGEEALALVATQPPDLILLDVMLPGMNGYEVATRIKADPATKSIPIVMITALDDRDARILGLSAGAEDFLSKPIDRAELCVRIRNLLRLKAYGDYHDKYGQMLESQVGARTADLVASERLYRSTFDAAPVGIVHVALDRHQWLHVNQRICELLGYTAEELQSGAVRDLLHAGDMAGEGEALQAISDGLLDRHVVDEKSYRRSDGRVMWARVYTSIHRDPDGAPRHFIKVIEDITERRALAAQLQQAGKMDAIGSLAAGIAHDFNNLLSVILSYSEMLTEDLSAGDPMRGDLQQIHGAAVRAVDLTRQLLAFSRQQVLAPKVIDLGDIVRGMETMLRRLLGEDVDLSVVTPPGLAKILVDPSQLERVIMNLAVNARDAMPQGGRLMIETSELIVDEAYASTRLGAKAGRQVVLAVTDTGVGMDTETQARMFEPFFTTKGVGKGTGLGLATVFGVVRQSGGSIWSESQVGRGTTFKISFPPVREPAPRTTQRTDPPTLRGDETILLVEDEAEVRILTRTILRKYGYTVLEAQSGGDAFLLCEQHTAAIDLLLTDVVMPRMSGRQLAERLLLVRPAMKVLYMSGYTDDAVVRHGILEGAVAFIQKPITPEPLARKIRETLDGPVARSPTG
jgi:two-component system cell cycle sensor histidine kinase/response regulator CckA